MKRFKVVTLGCRTNQYESQAYRDQLLALGLQEAEKEADLCIVNTCTVTQSADSSSRAEIRRLVKENKGAQVVVTGCLAERSPEELLQIEGVTALVGNKEKDKLLAAVFPELELPPFMIQEFSGHTRAFVKVQDGCNSFCTYCIIPYVRGRSRSRRIEDIVKEVEGLVESGFREVVLTGINIGDFDGAPVEGEGVKSLADLIRALELVEGIERIRISSIDPDEVDDELLRTIVESKKCCPSMHLVLQSGSNVILKRMNRKYTRNQFFEAVERLKSACSDFTFTTDIIVGFPGETEEDFAQTVEAIEKVRFAKVHLFPYSDRERTRAFLYPNKISSNEKDRRKKILFDIAEKAAFLLREEFVGRRERVLVESKEEGGLAFGHTAHFLPVYFPKENVRPNEFVNVEIRENLANGLKGKLV